MTPEKFLLFKVPTIFHCWIVVKLSDYVHIWKPLYTHFHQNPSTFISIKMTIKLKFQNIYQKYRNEK